MTIDSFCFLFSPRFSLSVASYLGGLSGRCARAAVIVGNAGKLSDQRPFSGRHDSTTTETL
jgi:hypothetical protein